DVDIARTVERIKKHNVLTRARGGRDDLGLATLLRAENGDVAAKPETALDRLVGDHVELLLHFAMDVAALGIAQNIEQAGAANLGLNNAGGERDSGEQPTEFACRGRVLGLLGDHGLL